MANERVEKRVIPTRWLRPQKSERTRRMDSWEGATKSNPMTVNILNGEIMPPAGPSTRCNLQKLVMARIGTLLQVDS
ncbi:hypothetical protein JHK84_030886 [Glycine max]|nr:hypothetical protein JHK84_030886 [Glycine max]